MKHQYFGDTIDLFKYDLLETLFKDLRFNEILFVPLLTKNDGSGEGNKRNYKTAKAGNNNVDLVKFFLEKFSHKDDRNMKVIEEYYKKNEISIRIDSDKIFNHKDRKQYFSNLVVSLNKNQLLFFDPDNGMEIKKNRDKHILYSEIKNTLDACTCDDSVISVIQFNPRQKWENANEKRKSQLIENSFLSTFISDRNITFHFIAKSQKRLSEVKNSLKKYKEIYPLLLIEEE